MTTPHTDRLGLQQRKAPAVSEPPAVSASDASLLPPDGVVSVSRWGWRWRGHCTCRRWTFRRRVLRSVAVLDALAHAARCGCKPAVPLVAHSSVRAYRGARS